MAACRFNKPGENLNYAPFVSNVRLWIKLSFIPILSASAEAQIHFCPVAVKQGILKGKKELVLVLSISLELE